MRSSAFAVTALVACTLFPVPAVITAQDESPTAGSATAKVVVSGEGRVHRAPDTGEIDVGVVTEAELAKDAVEANNDAMTKLLSTLKQLDIADKDVQTTNFSVSPRYRNDPNRRESPPDIIGYRVTNQVRVRVRRLDSLGEVLDRVVSVGANRINGIAFSIGEPQDATDEARRLAVRDARRKAELLADEAGIRLGRVLEVTEDSGQPRPLPRRRMQLSQAADSVPIASGEQTVTARVEIVFEVADDAEQAN